MNKIKPLLFSLILFLAAPTSLNAFDYYVSYRTKQNKVHSILVSSNQTLYDFTYEKMRRVRFQKTDGKGGGHIILAHLIGKNKNTRLILFADEIVSIQVQQLPIMPLLKKGKAAEK